MKIFGSIRELVATIFRKNNQEITLRPSQSTTYTAARDFQLPPGDSDQVLTSASSSQTLTGKTIDGDDNTLQDIALSSLKTNVTDANKFLNRNGSGVVISSSKAVPGGDVVGTTDSQTLTNKTIDADQNTVTNIEDADIKSGAAIDATKIANGSVDNGEFQKLGTAGTVGAGNLVTTDGTQTLSNKTIDGDDNIVQDLALTSLKTQLADADKVIRRDASGIVISGNSLPNSSTIVTTDASQTLTGKTIDGDNNTVQDLALSTLKTVLGDADKVIRRDASGVVISGNSLPNSSTIVTTDASQTLTSKTYQDALLSTSSGGPQVRSGNPLKFNNSGDTGFTGLKGPAGATSVEFTLPVADGTSGQLMRTDGSGNLSFVSQSAPVFTWVTKTANYTAVAGDNLFADSSGGAFTITLPASAVIGDTIRIVDPEDTHATNNIIVARNGLNIMGSATDLTMKVNGATITLVYYNSAEGWRVIEWFEKYKTISEVWVTAGNGHGSTNTNIRRFTTTVRSVGTAITYADSATNGGSFTINEDGIYSVTYVDRNTAAGSTFGISKNSNQLTTTILSITNSHRLGLVRSVSTDEGAISVTFEAISGDIIRAHTDTTPQATVNQSTLFRITKVSI
jgi:hypothetical protein